MFDIVESLLDVISSIPAKLKAECACQVRKFDKKYAGGLQCRGQVRYKVFGEGIIESVDEANKTYHIRFVNGIKPISP